MLKGASVMMLMVSVGFLGPYFFIECTSFCRQCETGRALGISTRVRLRTAKSDRRQRKPRSYLSKERLRNDLNTVTNREKVCSACSCDLKQIQLHL